MFNWDSKTPGLAVLFAQMAHSSSSLGGNFSTWQAEAERYFDRIVNKQGPAYMTNGGLSPACPSWSIGVLTQTYRRITLLRR